MDLRIKTAVAAALQASALDNGQDVAHLVRINVHSHEMRLCPRFNQIIAIGANASWMPRNAPSRRRGSIAPPCRMLHAKRV
ncbi:hypothetical protein CHELA20_52548 [Hyphomicrobiales bacterium]|nr:hypothetical protein CHELA41_22379 [Hyphomicrobiales bacterium]CAH1682201.1 hypothetical protein CHELA20_52548 [Hyphomicrobiales bacterium]